MEVFRSEIKVGLLILVSFVLLVAGIFLVSDLRKLWDKKKTLVLLFPYADGITRGSPVWYAGLEVGEVSDIRIATEMNDRIAVTVRVDPKARVRKDSRVDIRNLGMMGAKYVELSPGSPDSPELPQGHALEGKGPSSLSEVMESGQQVAARLVELIQETQTLIHEVRTESSIKETIQNANAFLVELREQGKDIKPVVEKLSSFAESLNETGTHLKKTAGEGGKELTALLKELRETNRGLQQGIEGLQTRLGNTLGQVDRGLSEAQGCFKDVRSLVASGQEDVASLLRHLDETARHFEALSEDLRAHPWKVVWRKDGTFDEVNSTGAELWRERGRIGPYGKE